MKSQIKLKPIGRFANQVKRGDIVLLEMMSADPNQTIGEDLERFLLCGNVDYLNEASIASEDRRLPQLPDFTLTASNLPHNLHGQRIGHESRYFIKRLVKGNSQKREKQKEYFPRLYFKNAEIRLSEEDGKQDVRYYANAYGVLARYRDLINIIEGSK